MKLERLKDYNIVIRGLLSGELIEINTFLAEGASFDYNTLYKIMARWVQQGLLITLDEEDRIPGGTKIRYRVTSEGKVQFQEIADVFSSFGNISASQDEMDKTLPNIEEDLRADAIEVIRKGMRSFSGKQLEQYIIKDLISLLQDSVYAAFENYIIVSKDKRLK